MQIAAATIEALMAQERSADHWRDRAECLEEWVCELLRKNQALRMALQHQQSQNQHRDGTTPAQLFLGSNLQSFPPAQPASGRNLQICRLS